MSRAAERYAKALMALATDQSADQMKEDLLCIEQTVNSNQELRIALRNPVIKPEVKEEVLLKVFHKSSEIIQDFLKVLVRNKRVDLLQAVCAAFTFQFDARLQIQNAKVTTAVALDAVLAKKVQDKIKQLTGYGARVENTVDPNILGGFVLRVGDLQYDASVARALSDVRRSLAEPVAFSEN